jgi:hypothetical protein
MGACYSVFLKVVLRDEEGAIKALNEHMESDKRTRYGLDRNKAIGVTPDTFDGLMKILLVEHQSDVAITQKGKFKIYENSFDASYGWESVMMEWFHALAPFLEDGSELLIHPDSDYDKLVIQDGKCVQVH